MPHCSFAVNNLCLVSWKTLAKSELPMKCIEVWSKRQLSESILFHCTKCNFMDMQKPSSRGRSSSINPGPREAAECKTPAVSRGDVGAWNWLMHYLNSWLLLWRNKEMFRYFNISLDESCFFVTRDFNNKGDPIPKSISRIKFSVWYCLWWKRYILSVASAEKT